MIWEVFTKEGRACDPFQFKFHSKSSDRTNLFQANFETHLRRKIIGLVSTEQSSARKIGKVERSPRSECFWDSWSNELCHIKWRIYHWQRQGKTFLIQFYSTSKLRKFVDESLSFILSLWIKSVLRFACNDLSWWKSFECAFSFMTFF